MAGRCGRRGLDTEGHVIYWGLQNYKDIKVDNIKLLKMPEINNSAILKNPKQTFYEIY